MTVPTSISKFQANGNGITTVFPFNFRILTDTDLVVVLTDADGADQPALTLDVDYTVAGVNDLNGGSVTYPKAGSGRAVLPAGWKITGRRVLPQTQSTALQNQGAYFPNVVEDAFDKLTMEVQQLQEQLNRSVKYSPTDPNLGTELPVSVTRANKAVVFDAEGNITVSGDDYDDQAANAAASATAAANSAAGAAGSAVQAAASATAAADSAATAVAQVAASGLPDAAAVAAATGGEMIRLKANKSGYEFLAPLDVRRDLRDLYLTLEDFGGVADNGVTDNTPALNALQAAVPGLGIYEVRLGVGNYGFLTKPDDITIGLRFKGMGISLSGLARFYDEADATKGFITFSGSTANGFGLENLSIVAGDGSTGGNLVRLLAPAVGTAASYGRIDQCYFSYGTDASYVRAIYIDGVANTLAGGQGLRDLHMSNIFVFDPLGQANYMIEARNAVNHFWNNIWCNGKVLISGGGSAATNSNVVHLSNVEIFGALFIENSTGVTITGASVGSLNIIDTASEGLFIGKIPIFNLTNQSSSFLVLDRSNTLQSALSNNGYQKLAGGGILQWQQCVSIPTGGTSFLFPAAYPNACLSCVATGFGSVAYFSVSAIGKAGFAIAGNIDGVSAKVISVGN